MEMYPLSIYNVISEGVERIVCLYEGVTWSSNFTYMFPVWNT